MSNLADLSLDEIIAKQKKSKGGARREGAAANRSVKQRGRGFTKKYESNDSSFTKTRDVPTGKWGHDGFDELYGNGSSRSTRSAPKVGAGSKTLNRSAVNRKVKLHISNLAQTVNNADLKELFDRFLVKSVVVHYDEMGQSVGTADVVTDRASAEEIKNEYSGVALDGKTMKMFIIDEASDGRDVKSVRERLTVGKRPVRSTRGITKRRSSGSFRLPRRSGGPVRSSGPARSGGPVRSGRSGRMGMNTRRPDDRRKKMTDAELDKELEEYMKKGTSAQTMES